ncbi:hypothetical protein [Brevundimonas sp. PAMC22021]|uniref:hypothetical protein n=1 Tax=Brevundimonas sp. PAMC22021 TaxID=2861285 RepID=UPI001C62B4BC|nr:hypothetical protein [Brevundimonas sp. PAMC22021]QYF87095.1 hypothetical protein KY493_00790 [Brevundimonas sp. PAMC22021]
MFTRIALAGLIAAVASPALAQTWTPYVSPYGGYPGGAPAAIADQHRYETERLRSQAETRDLFARQQQLETQLRRQRIEGARPLPLPNEPAYRPLRSPESERTFRESATERRQTLGAGVGQIDAWLDRRAE